MGDNKALAELRRIAIDRKVDEAFVGVLPFKQVDIEAVHKPF